MKDRRLIIWVDNIYNSARASLIKRISTSAAMHALAVAFAHPDAQFPSMW